MIVFLAIATLTGLAINFVAFIGIGKALFLLWGVLCALAIIFSVVVHIIIQIEIREIRKSWPKTTDWDL